MAQGTHLRDLVRALGWSYATLWSIPSILQELVWADGSFEASRVKRNESEVWNVERLFTSSYKACSFGPNSGYAGRVLAQGQPLWVTGAEAVVQHSRNSGQAHFFRVAGIQTLLCIPWYDSVVELGTASTVYESANLLLQIRAFLSHMPTAKQVQVHQQKQEEERKRARSAQTEDDAFSPVQGPLVSISQGLSGSDDASDGGNQVEYSCSSPFPLELRHHQAPAMSRKAGPPEWSAPLQKGAEPSPARSGTPMGHDLNEMVVCSGENDWRLDFSPTSTLQFKCPSASPIAQPSSALQHEESDFEASFLNLSPGCVQQMPLLGQLNYNNTNGNRSAKSSSQNSHSELTKDESSQERSASPGKQSPLRVGESISKKSQSQAFKPWRGGLRKSSSSSRSINQEVLRRSIDMTHRISQPVDAGRTAQLKTSPYTSPRPQKQQQKPVLFACSSAMEASKDVLSCHDEAAVNHMLAERKRRQKQKENFSALRALIPFVSKMDRASILGDAISYVKQLSSRVEELESINRRLLSQIPDSLRHSGSTTTSL